jgi:hypothetical protein
MACLFFSLLAACSAPKSEPPSSAPAPPAPKEPGIPIDTIEEIEGWVRFKGWSAAAQRKVEAVAGPKEVRISSGANVFVIPASDYRASTKEDYAEIQLGAHLKTPNPPQSVGAPIYDKNTYTLRTTEHCGGKPTVCIPVWNGCGPIACEASGEIIGVGCGGWTGASSPK